MGKKQERTVSPEKMAYLAMHFAYTLGQSYNVQRFSQICRHPVDRHLRAVLNNMVLTNDLKRENLKHEDGHYRLVYSAKYNPRQPMFPGFDREVE